MWFGLASERKSFMKIPNVLLVLALVLVMGGSASAQFKSQVEQESRLSGGLVDQGSSSFFFGWFDPSKFHMRHSFDLSYQTFGGQGVSLGTYTNSMTYAFAENLNVRTDISMSYSPYNTLPLQGGKKNDLSAIYLSRAEVNYRPWENFTVQLQYRQNPYGYSYYSPYYYSPFHSPFYREDGF
jgi:hypothetical protein